ncbi:AAA family ATPase, partial [Salmonella enterica]|nr:AAA family ATPase [Salmonella enterica]
MKYSPASETIFAKDNQEKTMRVEVMEHYGLTQSIESAGYYETAHHKQLMKDIKGAIREGRLIAVCGVVGSGKTVTLRRLQQQLMDENKIIVARSLSVDKQSVRLATLINALFYDLAQDKQVQIPKQGERRERELQELVKKGKRPVALFVDEAHDLNGNTLTGLKRLMEVVEDGGGRLSVVLAGHPKLRNDLRRPTMEEIGYRTDIFTLDGITGSQREYIRWLLKTSTGKGKPEDILTTEAVDLLAMKLRTPLQVQLHLTLAMEAGYQTGEKPITATLVESVLSRQLDD